VSSLNTNAHHSDFQGEVRREAVEKVGQNYPNTSRTVTGRKE
jgi:hypothetical protein